MEIPTPAIRHIQFIILGIWPVNILTLWLGGHNWTWHSTPQEIVGLWEWGAFVSFSLGVLAELGVRMFFALAERKRRIEEAREEGREEGRKEAQKSARREAGDMLMMLNAAARTDPDRLPSLLQEYQEKFRYGSANP